MLFLLKCRSCGWQSMFPFNTGQNHVQDSRPAMSFYACARGQGRDQVGSRWDSATDWLWPLCRSLHLWIIQRVPFLLILQMSLCAMMQRTIQRSWHSSWLFPTDTVDARSWEQENVGTQADESSPSALQRAAWGISETESDLTCGEVEQRLDLLQEQLNRYKQRESITKLLAGSSLTPCKQQIPTIIMSFFLYTLAYLK